MDVLDARLRVAGVSEAGIGEWSEVIESSTDIALFCGDPADMTTFRDRIDTYVLLSDSSHSITSWLCPLRPPFVLAVDMLRIAPRVLLCPSETPWHSH
jgi:hypothetical protein